MPATHAQRRHPYSLYKYKMLQFFVQYCSLKIMHEVLWTEVKVKKHFPKDVHTTLNRKRINGVWIWPLVALRNYEFGKHARKNGVCIRYGWQLDKLFLLLLPGPHPSSSITYNCTLLCRPLPGRACPISPTTVVFHLSEGRKYTKFCPSKQLSV